MERGRRAYVLRIWHEDQSPNEETFWRGSLQAVETGEIRYFTSLEQIADLLRQEDRQTHRGGHRRGSQEEENSE
jgi:hypothetical protein